MITLKGERIYLRALEPEDLELVFKIENNQTFWHLSNTQTPYSKFVISNYLKNAHKDIYEVKQLRLVISDYKNTPLGLIDVFDFDFKNKRAGIGIVIENKENRNKGYAKEALQLLIKYCTNTLQLHQLYCNILETNTASLNVFKSNNFKIVGLKQDWVFNNGNYQNEYLLQRIED